MSTTLAANVAAHTRRFGFCPTLAVEPSLVRRAADGAEVLSESGGWLAAHVADPLTDASHALDALGTDSVPPVLFAVGCGLGHLLNEIERRGWPTRVVLFEPEAGLARMLFERRSWERWIADGRLALLTGPDYAGAPQVARTIDDASGAPVVVNRAVQDARPAQTAAALDLIARLKNESAANAAARRALSSRYLLQTLGNAPRLTRESDAGRLWGAFAGVPAIVAGAGPSLDKNIHDIGAVADRAIVIACDTAARPLYSVGLSPHVIVALDPSAANACHLGALVDPGRTWLVGEASLHSSALTHFAGRTFFFKVSNHEPWPWLADVGLDRAKLEVWGSVLTGAVDLAVRMGCSPIVIAGADLAFTDGRPYCRGTSYESQWASWTASGVETYERVWQMIVDRWPVVMDVDVHGAPARTAPHLVAFRNWIAERSTREDDRRFVNATAGGILHGGRIEQSTALATLSSAPALAAAAVQQRLRTAHGGTSGPIARLFDRIEGLLTGPTDAGELRRWIDFTGGRVSPSHIREALAGPEYTAWTLGRGFGTTEGQP